MKRQPIKDQATPKVNRKNWNAMMERELGEGYSFTKKKCFVCGSLSHLIKDCDYYEKKMAREAEFKKQRVFISGNGRWQKKLMDPMQKVNHANKFVPRLVQLNDGRPNINSVRPNIKTGRPNINSVRTNINTGRTNINSVMSRVNTVNTNVNTVRSRQPVPTRTSNNFSPKRPQVNQFNQKRHLSKSYSSVRRPFAKTTAQMSHFHAVKGNWEFVVKTSAGYNWRNFKPNSNCDSGPTFIRTDHPLKNMVDRGIFDSGCSGHMTGNKDQLEDFKEFNGGSVTFGGSKGYISGKGKIRVANPHAGASEVANIAGTSQTSSSNASEEKDEDVELIVVPLIVKKNKASSTDTSEDNPKVLAFRKELEEIALKHLGKISENSSTSIPSVNTGSESVNTGSFDPDDSPIPELEIFHKSETGIFDEASYDEEGVITDFNSLQTEIEVSPTPTLRIHNIHLKIQILGDPKSVVQTRSKVQQKSGAHALFSFIQKQQRNNHKDQQHCLFACFLSQEEPKNISEALQDDSWVQAMQEELLQFKLQQVWVLVDLLTYEVTPKTSHLNAVKRIFKYLKGKPHLGLWYPRESPFDLEAFSDSDYGGSNLDRKIYGSRWFGCQFLGTMTYLIGNGKKRGKNHWFAEIVDFLRGSNLMYALTTNPTFYDSLSYVIQVLDRTSTAITIAVGIYNYRGGAHIDTIVKNIHDVDHSQPNIHHPQFRNDLLPYYSTISNLPITTLSLHIHDTYPEIDLNHMGATFEETIPCTNTLTLKRNAKSETCSFVKLVKKVKKLEGILKRRNVVFSDSEEEEPEDQGRKSQDESLVSFTVSGKVSTVSGQVSTDSINKSIPFTDKGQREGKALMIIEEAPKKTKEQILQEEG
ncbi:hypothetical protein Tco_0377828 [Tanacetum coccineum]